MTSSKKAKKSESIVLLGVRFKRDIEVSSRTSEFYRSGEFLLHVWEYDKKWWATLSWFPSEEQNVPEIEFGTEDCKTKKEVINQLKNNMRRFFKASIRFSISVS